MLIGLSGYLMVLDGFHPMIFVNFRPIFRNEVERNLSLAYEYYHNALLYSGSDPGKLDATESYNELKRAVIDETVSREIIMRELKSRIYSKEISEVAERKISNALDENPEIKEGVEKLYGLSLAEFREQILLPQAYREILEGRMNLNNQDFNSWLEKTRKESSVIILSSNFSWDGEKVILK